MSDVGRKDFTDKAKEAIVPESTKSDQDKAKEGLTDVGDKLGRGVQSDEHKSTTQEVADKAGRSKDTHVHGSSAGGVMDSVKHAVGLDKDGSVDKA